ncbi:Lysosomal Pro-X carboxypeptidase [Eumeta japonica]|uniref:Lysosomal Pro-X carboxypeptidase n=1 Tax=Eumeta variegata TaxID=151549 RepID=A0A4C1YKF3_EUMVA|nr:Lysosomal Pro-X carboxypeptidase [Eumeta japonica]
MEPAARTKNMTPAVLPRSEAFHLRLEVQARARNERQRGTTGLRVRHLSLSYLSARCVRVDSCYPIIHLHVFVKRNGRIQRFTIYNLYNKINLYDKQYNLCACTRQLAPDELANQSHVVAKRTQARIHRSHYSMVLTTVIVLLVFFGTVYGTPPYRYEINWFEVPLDHFGFNNSATFKIKYLVNEEHWNRDYGPIFFYTGNEGQIEVFLNHTGFMWDIAAEFRAKLVFAEHRYYGASMPSGNISLDNQHIGYLTSSQALADYADLVNYLQGNRDKPKHPVIAFGGKKVYIDRPIRWAEFRPMKSKQLGSQNRSSIGSHTVRTAMLFSDIDHRPYCYRGRYLAPFRFVSGSSAGTGMSLNSDPGIVS